MFCLILLPITTPIPCYAQKDEGEPMVYAYGDELDEIYEMLQKDSYDYKKVLDIYSLTILKESITPIYTVDMISYAQTGALELKPLWSSHTNKSDNGNGNVYIAKTITSDKRFGGNIMFYIEDGIAYHSGYRPSVYSNGWYDGSTQDYQASSSFADHAVRIAGILGEDKPVSEQDVKYVLIPWVGDFFYIKNDKHDIMISVGYMSADETKNKFTQTDYKLDTKTELLDIAKEQKIINDEFLSEKAAWEAAHPGEVWDYTGDIGYVTPPIINGCSSIDNIMDIYGYLGIAQNVSPNKESDGDQVSNADSASLGCQASFAGSVALIAAVTAGGAVIFKRKKEN